MIDKGKRREDGLPSKEGGMGSPAKKELTGLVEERMLRMFDTFISWQQLESSIAIKAICVQRARASGTTYFHQTQIFPRLYSCSSSPTRFARSDFSYLIASP